jgi:hypothetical protein
LRPAAKAYLGAGGKQNGRGVSRIGAQQTAGQKSPAGVAEARVGHADNANFHVGLSGNDWPDDERRSWSWSSKGDARTEYCRRFEQYSMPPPPHLFPRLQPSGNSESRLLQKVNAGRMFGVFSR